MTPLGPRGIPLEPGVHRFEIGGREKDDRRKAGTHLKPGSRRENVGKSQACFFHHPD